MSQEWLYILHFLLCWQTLSVPGSIHLLPANVWILIWVPTSCVDIDLHANFNLKSHLSITLGHSNTTDYSAVCFEVHKCLIFIMGMPILGKTVFILKQGSDCERFCERAKIVDILPLEKLWPIFLRQSISCLLMSWHLPSARTSAAMVLI